MAHLDDFSLTGSHDTVLPLPGHMWLAGFNQPVARLVRWPVSCILHHRHLDAGAGMCLRCLVRHKAPAFLAGMCLRVVIA
jgi:hypothetical protein